MKKRIQTCRRQLDSVRQYTSDSIRHGRQSDGIHLPINNRRSRRRSDRNRTTPRQCGHAGKIVSGCTQTVSVRRYQHFEPVKLSSSVPIREYTVKDSRTYVFWDRTRTNRIQAYAKRALVRMRYGNVNVITTATSRCSLVIRAHVIGRLCLPVLCPLSLRQRWMVVSGRVVR